MQLDCQIDLLVLSIPKPTSRGNFYQKLKKYRIEYRCQINNSNQCEQVIALWNSFACSVIQKAVTRAGLVLVRSTVGLHNQMTSSSYTPVKQSSTVTTIVTVNSCVLCKKFMPNKMEQWIPILQHPVNKYVSKRSLDGTATNRNPPFLIEKKTRKVHLNILKKWEP